MTRRQAEIILAYAQSNMNTKMTSGKVFMCSQNVRYHLRAIRDQMGWDPCKFYDLCYLVGIAVQRMNSGKNDIQPLCNRCDSRNQCPSNQAQQGRV